LFLVTVRHPRGTCKHVLWAVAAALEERAAIAQIASEQLREQEAEAKAQPQTPAERPYLRIVPTQAAAEEATTTPPKPRTKQPNNKERAIKCEQRRQESRQQKNAESWAFLRAHERGEDK
jgi:hypothetical protein